MAINTPEELLNRVTECMNNKDLDTFVSLYEPEGSFIDESGENINGHEKIREKIKGFMDMNGKLEVLLEKLSLQVTLYLLIAIGHSKPLVLTELLSTSVEQQ